MTSNAELDRFRFTFRKKQDGVKLSVYDGKKLIGVVGAITEGYCYPDASPLAKYRKAANVVSAEILPGYRGKKLYQEMLLRLREYAKNEVGCKGLRSDGFQRSSMATRAWKKLNPRVEVVDSFGRENLFLDGLGGSMRKGKFLYHDTNKRNLQSILANGLLPQPDPEGEGTPSTYATNLFADAKERLLRDEVTLRFKWQGRRLHDWQPSSDAFEVFYPVSPADLEVWSGSRWRPLAEAARGGLKGLPTKGRIPLETVKRALSRLPKKSKACGFTAQELREGMEIEREHRDVTGGAVGTTAKIAAAHLCESGPRYYKRIKKYVER
jgi:hypothetical protein